MTQRQGEAQKEEIRIKTEVELFKNRKEAELAEYKAGLATKSAGWSQASQLAEVESTKAVTLREAELQTEVEKKKVLTQTEKLRAELLSKAAVEYETKVYLVVKLILPPSHFFCPLFHFEMSQNIVLFLKIKVINLLMFLLYPY